MPNKILEYSQRGLYQARGMSVWAILSLVTSGVYLAVIWSVRPIYAFTNYLYFIFLLIALSLFCVLAGLLGIRDADRENRLGINYLFCGIGLLFGGHWFVYWLLEYLGSLCAEHFRIITIITSPVSWLMAEGVVLWMMTRVGFRHKQLVKHWSWILLLVIILVQQLMIAVVPVCQNMLWNSWSGPPTGAIIATRFLDYGIWVFIGLGLLGTILGVLEIFHSMKSQRPAGNLIIILFALAIIWFMITPPLIYVVIFDLLFGKLPKFILLWARYVVTFWDYNQFWLEWFRGMK